MYRRSIAIPMLALAASAVFAKDTLVPVAGSPDSRLYSVSAMPAKIPSTMNIVVTFKNIDEAGSESFVASQYDPGSPNFQHWISQSEFGHRFGATDSDIAAVKGYLVANGFTNIQVSDNKLMISADATQSQAAAAFHTSLGSFDRPFNMVARGEPPMFYGPNDPPKAPASIADKIAGVYGLADFLIQHPMGGKVIRRGMKKAGPDGYWPIYFSTAYNTTKLHNLNLLGQGMRIAVYSPTKRTVSDTATFAQMFGITGYTVSDKIVGAGPANSGGADEAALDIETIIGQAPRSIVYVLEPDGTPSGELTTMNVIMPQTTAPVLSSSWGFEENDVIAGGAQQFATDFNNSAKTLSASGISIFVAAGDSGVYSRNNYPKMTTGMETSAQYVTSVGGTNLELNFDATWFGESAWSYDQPTNSGGGGGLSQLFTRPSWQTGPGVANSFSNGKRQVPDVSADADPATGYSVFTQGQWTVIGGTSAATPLWAANVLLMDQNYRKLTGVATKAVGNISPTMYLMGTLFENPGRDYAGLPYLFHDITIGQNGHMSCTTSWDFVCGWGSADFNKVMVDLGSYIGIIALRPDFIPYNPHAQIPAWTKPVMIHTSTGSVTEPATFKHTDTLYFGVSMLNQGASDGTIVNDVLKIDNVIVKTYNFGALPPGYFAYSNSIYSGKLTAGTHTITFVVNNGNAYAESNYPNNTYSRTITVQ